MSWKCHIYHQHRDHCRKWKKRKKKSLRLNLSYLIIIIMHLFIDFCFPFCFKLYYHFTYSINLHCVIQTPQFSVEQLLIRIFFLTFSFFIESVSQHFLHNLDEFNCSFREHFFSFVLIRQIFHWIDLFFLLNLIILLLLLNLRYDRIIQILPILLLLHLHDPNYLKSLCITIVLRFTFLIVFLKYKIMHLHGLVMIMYHFL